MLLLEARNNLGQFSLNFAEISSIVGTSNGGTNITMTNGNVLSTDTSFEEVISRLLSFKKDEPLEFFS